MKVSFIIGIDSSISGTGVRIFDVSCQHDYLFTYTNKTKQDWIFSNEDFTVEFKRQPRPNIFNDKFERYRHVSQVTMDWVFSIVGDAECAFYIEDYAFGAIGKQFTIGEYCALLKDRVYEKGFIVEVVSPGEVKKTLTGKGNSKKEDIWNKLSYEGPLKNILNLIDEFYPWKMGHPVEDVIDAWGVCETFLKK